MYIGLHVKYPLILMTLEFSRHIFEKYIKFHEDSSRRSRIVPCGQTEGRTDRQTWRRWWSLFASLWTPL